MALPQRLEGHHRCGGGGKRGRRRRGGGHGAEQPSGVDAEELHLEGLPRSPDAKVLAADKFGGVLAERVPQQLRLVGAPHHEGACSRPGAAESAPRCGHGELVDRGAGELQAELKGRDTHLLLRPRHADCCSGGRTSRLGRDRWLGGHVAAAAGKPKVQRQPQAKPHKRLQRRIGGLGSARTIGQEPNICRQLDRPGLGGIQNNAVAQHHRILAQVDDLDRGRPARHRPHFQV
mmetsp:Transcript_99197/g.285355  ORF Transcript_99197/g.285355 Transcript_99197/m.285355 type:complete len:233 (+) Transcript_99197:133-831(+)